MKYLVQTRYIFSGEWRTIYREFSNEEAANAYAQEMSNCHTDGDEMVVLIYELKKSYN